MTYRSLSTIIRELREKRENQSQYRSLTHAARSIYNRQITPASSEPTEQELAHIQNIKQQVKLKIIDNP
jgi:hypothetical protein